MRSWFDYIMIESGYFAVNQKSERMITIYLILSMAALVLRGIVTLLLIISQGMI